MGNRVVRIILGIIIAVAAVVGIYFILPGSIKHPLQEKFQSMFNSDQYETVTYLKTIKVPGYEDITFGDMVEYAGKHGSWVIDYSDVGEDKKSGSYEIFAYIYDVDISMAQENGQDNRVNLSQASVEIRFNVKRTLGQTPEYVVSSYEIALDETNQNSFYKGEALRSLAKTASANKAKAPKD